jgi:TatD DNase family protein
VIDTHCHLTHKRFAGEADAVVARGRDAGLTACITIGTGVEDARRGAELAARHPGFVVCAAGIDPFTSHAKGAAFDDELAALRALLEGGGFVALGEFGLDYHYDLDSKPVQAERFARQLDLASALELPVVIHVRDAHEDAAAILSAHPGTRGVIHSFTGGPREARRYLDLGLHLGFNGIVTFPTAKDVREAARLAPADRVLIETDSPYLAPVPFRGKRCEPAHIVHTLRRLAEVRGEAPEALAAATTANAVTLFGLASG